MKTIFESVIARGDYNLTDLLGKIDSYHVMGRLTDAERDELYAKARAGALDALGYDVKAEICAFYRLFYGCELTDAQYDTLTAGAFLGR